MRFPEDVSADVDLRLRRLEGQIRGIQRMLAEGQDCEAVVTQLAAAKAALDRVSFRLMAAGMRCCVTAESADAADLAGSTTGDDGDHGELAVMEVADLEKLFLKLS